MPVNEISFDPFFKLNYLSRDSAGNILLKINNCHYTQRLIQMVDIQIMKFGSLFAFLNSFSPKD